MSLLPNGITSSAPYFGILASAAGIAVSQFFGRGIAAWLFIGNTLIASLWAVFFFGLASTAPHFIFVSFAASIAFLPPKQSRIFSVLAVCAFTLCALPTPQHELLGLSRDQIDTFLTRPLASLGESALLSYIIFCLFILTGTIYTQFNVTVRQRAQLLGARFEDAQNRFLAKTSMHRFLPRALLILDQNDRVIGASYVFLNKAGMSLNSIKGKPLSDIARTPSNEDINLELDKVLINLVKGMNARPALAKVYKTSILGKKIQTVVDIEFPRELIDFKPLEHGSASFIGDSQIAQQTFDRYLQSGILHLQKSVIRLNCTDYPALISRFDKSVADDALTSYLERLPKAHVKATLRVSGATTAVLIEDDSNIETLTAEIRKQLNSHSVHIFEQDWQLKFEVAVLKFPIEFNDSRSFCLPRNESHLANRDLTLRERVLKQIASDGFLFHFQPVHRIQGSREFLFSEALARWNGSEPLPPPMFIGMANELGLGRAMTKCLIRAFCKAYKQLNRSCGTTQTVSFNMSAADVQDASVRAYLHDQIKAADLPPHNIIIELIETLQVEDISSFINDVQELTKIGFKIAIDDFGRAFSSVERLMQLPFDYLKLDGTLCSASTSGSYEALLGMVVNIGKELKVPIIAEGIENKEDQHFIEKLGITWCQGYLFSRPADPTATAGILLESTDA